ncbi:MAG: hypothetical protein F6J98_30350 [Moorea sp. SIO4G2]|uniref:hypothetical protein n=1 Tax=unclassified Moorena TaxID=2683338 RepID=UPI0013C8F490|nr:MULTISPECIES: hypothetical protein [unclassified Moorena]NEO24913.1 hypothetical protein [Moorena sp. SIO4A5]NEO48889.1 hypothetical protein [Moorena sp. SIO4A3]NEO64481.1 hypothetical protein [Moorena sp. SIO4G2]NEP27082.1 hypothetical protein [Moorena sp. SIO3I6]
MATFKSVSGDDHEHIYGGVDQNGKMWGEGFTVTKGDPGCYTITFNPDKQFGEKPGVVASVYVDENNTYSVPNLSVSVSNVSVSSFDCYTTNEDGDLKRAPFTFIAFGEKKK